MAQEFRLPDIGEGLAEAEIVRWLVAEGDLVESDQPVVEVETDKAVVEIPSPFAGTVLRLGGAPGDVIEVGEVLIVIGEADDEAAQHPNDADSADEGSDEEVDQQVEPVNQPVVGSPPEVAPIVGTLSEDAEVLKPRTSGPASSGSRAKALPLVRKLARDQGVDIESVEGTGPDGRITREDVLAAAGESSGPQADAPAAQDSQRQVPAVDQPAPATEEAAAGPGGERMSRLRRTIAENMSKSWREIPHVTTFDDVDASRLLEARSALAARYNIKVPLESLVVKAILPALDAYPDFNSSIDGDDLVHHSRRDIGIAVDTPEGLMVAVVRDAGSLSVLDLASEIERLGSGARQRALAPDELSGQTFTVSNIGAVGGGHGTPIVPYGTTAILSVGRATERPVVRGGELAIAPLMPLSLSYDHRVIDGAVGRRFMKLIMENLEEPALFLAS